ncbi:hypothetical protein BGZ49_005309 [Haplosporangium sp. Z 27]|nr:hypothetical protein BGZ49_005309 [Haplosporangium sp. Z 27]
MGSYPKAFAVGFGIVGAAYALMITTVPTDEQLYQAGYYSIPCPGIRSELIFLFYFGSGRLSPELKKQYEIVKADDARRQAFSDVLKAAAENPEPMWIKKKETPKDQ